MRRSAAMRLTEEQIDEAAEWMRQERQASQTLQEAYGQERIEVMRLRALDGDRDARLVLLHVLQRHRHAAAR